MKLKRIATALMSLVLALSIFGANVSAKDAAGNIAHPMYQIAINPSSTLSLSGNTATCYSYVGTRDTATIIAEQTIQMHVLASWVPVNGASWSKTVKNSTSFSMQNTKSGLPVGNFRLKTVFNITTSSGTSESVTAYSA